MFGITAALFTLLLDPRRIDLAYRHTSLIPTISNVSAGGKPVDNAQLETPFRYVYALELGFGLSAVEALHAFQLRSRASKSVSVAGATHEGTTNL